MNSCQVAGDTDAVIRISLLNHIFALVLGASLFLPGLTAEESISAGELYPRLQEGDLVFQQSTSAQSEAIRQATGSVWTHIGVMVWDGGKLRLLEAGSRGVAFVELSDFAAASRKHQISVMRLVGEGQHLTKKGRKAFREALRTDMGKQYDRLFEWSDTRIYCSELVWRAYQNSMGLTIGTVQHMGELDYQKPAVLALVRERYKLNKGELAESQLLREKIITPAAMKESPLISTVFEGEVRP